jgi:hypothetical protein
VRPDRLREFGNRPETGEVLVGKVTRRDRLPEGTVVARHPVGLCVRCRYPDVAWVGGETCGSRRIDLCQGHDIKIQLRSGSGSVLIDLDHIHVHGAIRTHQRRYLQPPVSDLPSR